MLEKENKLDETFKELALKENELKKLQDEIQNTKEKNLKEPFIPDDPNEQHTRELFIDLLLKEAGWDIHAKDAIEFEVQGMPNSEGIGYVDYVLWGDDGLPLGLVEAKRTRKNPTVGRQQAKLYADCLEQMYKQRPVIYYSNGFHTYMWDDLNYNPREVQGFYSKDELRTIINRRGQIKPASEYKIDKTIAAG